MNTTDEGEEKRRDDDEINSDTAANSTSGKRKREPESLPDVEETGLLAVSSGQGHGDETQPPSPAGRYFDQSRGDDVWEYKRLCEYKRVNGKPFVLVDWCRTWEPATEFSIGEVENVRRGYGLQRRRKRGGP